MTLEVLEGEFTVCRMKEAVLPKAGRFFLGVTDREVSLVCESAHLPAGVQKAETGWRAFRVAGAMDFGLTGVLARLAGTLAAAEIPIFAVSTYDTDYILVKKALLARALACLREEGLVVEEGEC